MLQTFEIGRLPAGQWILSAKKTSLASRCALPAHMGFAKRITEHSTAEARDLVRDKGPRSLLAAPSTLPETASASPRAGGPPAAARPESPRLSPAIAGSVAERDPRRTH